MASNVKLPEGFVLDAPRNAVNAPAMSLPEGFVLDAPQEPSIASQGLSYVKEHPYKTILDPALKTLTGKSLYERSLEAPIPTRMTGNKFMDAGSSVGQFAQGFTRDAAAMAGDVATSPITAITAGLGAIPAVQKAGAAIAATKPAQALGRFLTKNRKPVQVVKQFVDNIRRTKDPIGLARNVRAQLFQRKKEVGEAFESGIKALSEANPAARVDLSPQFDGLKTAMADATENPGLAQEVKAIVRRVKDPEQSKLLLELIENPSKAADLTLQQSQDIKVAIQNAPAIKTKLAQGKFADYRQSDIELLDLLDDIKLAQSDVFPELAEVRKPYAQYMQNYKEVKNYFKPKSLIGRMKNGFGNEETEAMVKAVLPEETFGDIKAYKKALQAITLLKNLGLTAAGGTVAGAAAAKGYQTFSH